MIDNKYLKKVIFSDGSIEKYDGVIFDFLTSNVIEESNNGSYFGRDQLSGKMCDVIDVTVDGMPYTINTYHLADIIYGDYTILEG